MRRRRTTREVHVRRVAFLAIATCGVAAIWLLLPRPAPTELTASAGLDAGTTPDLYGAHSEVFALAGGSARFVDDPGSSVPVVLLVAGPGHAAEDWAAIQALLDRDGVASLAVAAGDAPPAVDSIRAIARRRSQPAGIVTNGASLDALLGSSRAEGDVPLVVLDPRARRRSTWQRVLAWLPDWLPGQGEAADLRLAEWGARVLVMSTSPERRDSLTAVRLVRGARAARLRRAPGAEVEDGTLHPDETAWMDIVEFLRGVRVRQAIVQSPSDSAE